MTGASAEAAEKAWQAQLPEPLCHYNFSLRVSEPELEQLNSGGGA